MRFWARNYLPSFSQGFTVVSLTSRFPNVQFKGGWQRGLEPSLHDRPSKEIWPSKTVYEFYFKQTWRWRGRRISRINLRLVYARLWWFSMISVISSLNIQGKVSIAFFYLFSILFGCPSAFSGTDFTSFEAFSDTFHSGQIRPPLSLRIVAPGSNLVDLADMRCKHYYKILNKNPTVEPTGIKTWKVNFADTHKEWKNKFSFVFQSTRDNKLRQFSFRLLHRIIVTKKELHKFRLTDDATCTFCPNSDSIEHTFLDCSETKSFYYEALMWFNRVNETEIELSNEQITFNEIPDFHQLSEYPRRRLHLFVILLKQYVYSCKCLEKKPIQKEFQNKMLMQWQIEKCALH